MRGLTLRASGRPPAWRLAREPANVIIRLAGQVPYAQLKHQATHERTPDGIFPARLGGRRRVPGLPDLWRWPAQEFSISHLRL